MLVLHTFLTTKKNVVLRFLCYNQYWDFFVFEGDRNFSSSKSYFSNNFLKNFKEKFNFFYDKMVKKKIFIKEFLLLKEEIMV